MRSTLNPLSGRRRARPVLAGRTESLAGATVARAAVAKQDLRVCRSRASLPERAAVVRPAKAIFSAVSTSALAVASWPIESDAIAAK